MPGLKPGSFAESIGPDGHLEWHTSVCAHCQSISDFPSMRKMHEAVDVCRGCMRLICLRCAGKPCRPHEKEVERLEAEARLGRKIESRGWGCY